MDLHEDIHRVVEAYNDANEFRRTLNSAIQTARGVTFLLQKRKAKWSDFDLWYSDWQDNARTNKVLSWSVSARNRVVKEEDLNTLSQAKISYYGERLLEAEQSIEVDPRTTVDEILAQFAGLAAETPAGRPAWIHIERRWVEDQLPTMNWLLRFARCMPAYPQSCDARIAPVTFPIAQRNLSRASVWVQTCLEDFLASAAMSNPSAQFLTRERAKPLTLNAFLCRLTARLPRKPQSTMTLR
jgi:hypothetical protein